VKDELIQEEIKKEFVVNMNIVDEEEIKERLASKFEKETDNTKINPKPWEVADICFGKEEMNEVKYLDALTLIRNNFIKASIKIRRSKDEELNEKLRAEQEVLKEKF